MARRGYSIGKMLHEDTDKRIGREQGSVCWFAYKTRNEPGTSWDEPDVVLLRETPARDDRSRYQLNHHHDVDPSAISCLCASITYSWSYQYAYLI